MVPTDAALFLDEPTTALDAERRANIVSWLRAEAHERRVMVFATHDSDLAQIADYVLRLSQGRLINFTWQEHSLHPVKQQA
jgi:ABC-type lipoprotein export system ATPase subunit